MAVSSDHVMGQSDEQLTLEKREKEAKKKTNNKKPPTQKPKVSTGCFTFTEPLFFSLHGGVGAAESHIHRRGVSLRFRPHPHLRGIQLFWLLPININQVSFVQRGSCKARRRAWMMARLDHYIHNKNSQHRRRTILFQFFSPF